MIEAELDDFKEQLEENGRRLAALSAQVASLTDSLPELPDEHPQPQQGQPVVARPQSEPVSEPRRTFPAVRRALVWGLLLLVTLVSGLYLLLRGKNTTPTA